MFSGLIILGGCSGEKRYHREIDQLLSQKQMRYQAAAKIGEYAYRFPEDLEQLAVYANTLLELGFNDECIEICNHILNLDKSNIKVLRTRAMAYANTWNFEESLHDLKTIKAGNNLNTSDIETLTIIRQHSAIYQEILKTDNKIKTSPSDFDLFRQRADFFLSMNEPEAAISDYQYFLDSSGFDLDVVLNKFRAGILAGDFAGAENDILLLRSHLGKDAPLDPGILSTILEETKRFTGMLNSQPGLIEPYTELARIFTTLDLEFKALDYLKQALKIQPGNDQIRYRMALVYVATGDTARAKDILTELKAAGLEIPGQLETILE